MIIKPEHYEEEAGGGKSRKKGLRKAFFRLPPVSKCLDAWNKAKNTGKQQRKIHETIAMLSEGEGKYALFHNVEIETINRCNGVCSFCPVNKKADIREFRKMDRELFIKIINELRELKFSGNLALHSNNEPFLDTRIEEFAGIVREALPEVYIYLYTNGTILTEERFLRIIPLLDELVIDNYNDEFEMIEPVRKIHELCMGQPELDKKVKIYLLKEDELRSTRGGQSPNNKSKKTLLLPCFLPYVQLIVRPDGKVSLCCQDVYGVYTLGDISKQSIREIWYSENYVKVRETLRSKHGRGKMDVCRYCDKTSIIWKKRRRKKT